MRMMLSRNRRMMYAGNIPSMMETANSTPKARNSQNTKVSSKRRAANSAPHARRSPLLLEATHNERDILAAKAKTVAEGMVKTHLAGRVRDIVEIAFRIGKFVVDGRRRQVPPHRHHASDQLNCPRRGNQVPQHALAAADRHLVCALAEHLLDGERLYLVVHQRTSAVSVDVPDSTGRQSRVGQGALHAGDSAPAVGMAVGDAE